MFSAHVQEAIEEHEIVDVAAVSAGNDYTVENMIADALKVVGKQGFIRIETGRCTENSLEVVEGMQFERGYLSPYFVTDRASMSVGFSDCKNTEDKFDKKIINERIARLSDGIAIIQVGAQTVVELKDKKLRDEDALNATRAAIEEGVVVGGGCCLLRLSLKVDSIKEFMDNEEQKVGADIFKQVLSYPSKLIAKNAGMNGNVVVEKA